MIRLVLLVSLSLPVLGHTQTQFLADSDVPKISEAIIASMAAGNAPGAWKQLRPLSVVPSGEFDVFEAQYGSQHAQVLQRLGSPLDYEHIRTEKVGKSLQRLQYIIRHERAPLRWELIYYRAKKGWVVIDFQFDGNVRGLFGASN